MSPAYARNDPSRAPPAASSKLSINNWPTSRDRLAPSDVRIAISFSRAAARASSMFATLLHAMSSSNPTAPAIVVQRRAELSDDAVDPTDDVDVELFGIVAGIDGGEPVRDHLDVGGRLLQRDPRLQACLEHEVTILDGRVGAVQVDRPVDVGGQLREPLRHDADERRGDAVENEGLSQDAGIEVVLPEPQLVRHDEYRRRARLPVVLGQAAAEHRRHPEKPEHVGRDDAAAEQLGAFTRRQQHVFARAADDLLEHAVLCLIVEKLRHLKEGAPAGLATAEIVNLNGRDPPRVDVRERIEERVLDDAEHRR